MVRVENWVKPTSIVTDYLFNEPKRCQINTNVLINYRPSCIIDEWQTNHVSFYLPSHSNLTFPLMSSLWQQLRMLFYYQFLFSQENLQILHNFKFWHFMEISAWSIVPGLIPIPCQKTNKQTNKQKTKTHKKKKKKKKKPRKLEKYHEIQAAVSILQENQNYFPALSVAYKILPQILPQLQSYICLLTRSLGPFIFFFCIFCGDCWGGRHHSAKCSLQHKGGVWGGMCPPLRS